MISAQVVVVPGLFLVKLWTVRLGLVDLPPAIKRQRDGAFVVLTSNYVDKFWYWEILVIIVRLICCGLLSKVFRKQSVRLGVTSFVSIVYLFLCAVLQPLGRPSLGRVFGMCNLYMVLVINLGSMAVPKSILNFYPPRRHFYFLTVCVAVPS